MKVLYEPVGRAREYSELAANLYSGGCPHRCEYLCYVPAMLHKSWAQWQSEPCHPREGVLAGLHSDILRIHKRYLLFENYPQVFLCFSCDPFPMSIDTTITEDAIRMLHSWGFPVRILTKNGPGAEQYFGMLGPGDAYGVTLTSLRDAMAARWEPGAASASQRYASLTRAKQLRIPTWVSLEPVIDPKEALDIISVMQGVAGEIKIGRWNYNQRAAAIDWQRFAHDAADLCEKLGLRYTLKEDLAKYLEAGHEQRGE